MATSHTVPEIAGINLFAPRGQIILMLLTALKEEGSGTRQETCNRISHRGWFDIQGEDWPPYPTMTNLEPRWRTLIAWARKDSFDFGYLDDIGHNCWQISRQGRQRSIDLKTQFAQRQLDVRRCYMWREPLKRFMWPDYTPSASDATRPQSIYRDELHHDRFQHILSFLHPKSPKELRPSDHLCGLCGHIFHTRHSLEEHYRAQHPSMLRTIGTGGASIGAKPSNPSQLEYQEFRAAWIASQNKQSK
jgi:hypothetical protein